MAMRVRPLDSGGVGTVMVGSGFGEGVFVAAGAIRFEATAAGGESLRKCENAATTLQRNAVNKPAAAIRKGPLIFRSILRARPRGAVGQCREFSVCL
jgi:hypothetical protein